MKQETAYMYLEFWYEALRSPRGIVIETEVEGMVRVRALLYAAREAANDPDLARIAIIVSPTVPGQLWLVKKEQPDGEGF